MSPEADAIDPVWWAGAFTDENQGLYEPAHRLSTRLEDLLKPPGLGELQRNVLEVLVRATSAMLKPGDWLSPFEPAITFVDGRRSVLPADLTPEQVALLAQIAPLVDRADLRARVADVAWLYGDRSDVAMLDRAIDAYRAAPLVGSTWMSAGKDAWQRAFDLANRRGPDGRTRVAEMAQSLKGQVLSGTTGDGFRVPAYAQMLRHNGRLNATEREEVTRSLVALAAATKTINPRLSRHLEREAAAWIDPADTAAVNAAVEREARTYIAEADSRIAADPKAGALVEGPFLEKAIARFRTLPRSYRQANGIDNLIDELRARLQASRETALESMLRFESDPVDLTNAVSFARTQVSGHQSRFEALVRFATLVPPMDAEETRASAEQIVQGSLSRIFSSSTFSSDARKVAASPGSVQPEDDPAIWSEMVRTITFHADLAATGLILPALEILPFEHRFDREYLTWLCLESPTVPEGHARLWGAALAFGLAGDYGPAIAIALPQLEHVVRTILKRRGVHTLHVDENTGVETEKSLNALLAMADTAEVFGAGTTMEMEALLVVQAGPNMRNDTAHGLLDDRAAWSLHAAYLWWFCLRLVLWPVIQMVDTAAREQQDGGEAASDER